MRIDVKKWVAVGGSIALLGVGGQVVAQRAVGGPVGQRRIRARAERHPELMRALRNLQRAQANLQHAAHDFKGHREKALDLTQHAIAEVQAALASDPH